MKNKQSYKYNEYIDVDNISIDQEDDYRYSLSIPFKNPINDKSVVVFMRNPSKADKTNSDKTINNVLRFCHTQYSKVYIANLYPYYETDSSKVKDFIESDLYDLKMERNSQIMETLYNKTNDIIIAWGTNNNTGRKYKNNYESVANSLLTKLVKANKNIYAMRFASSINPWHPRNWEENFNLELYKWNL